MVLGIEDSVSELFIAIGMYGHEDVEEVTMHQVSKFAEAITNEGKKHGINIWFDQNREQVSKFFSYNRSNFTEIEKDRKLLIKKNEGVCIPLLIYDYNNLPLDVQNEDLEKEALKIMGLTPKTSRKNMDTAAIRPYIENLEKTIRDELSKDIEEIDFDRCEDLRKKLKKIKTLERICIESDERRAKKGKAKKYTYQQE